MCIQLCALSLSVSCKVWGSLSQGGGCCTQHSFRKLNGPKKAGHLALMMGLGSSLLNLPSRTEDATRLPPGEATTIWRKAAWYGALTWEEESGSLIPTSLQEPNPLILLFSILAHLCWETRGHSSDVKWKHRIMKDDKKVGGVAWRRKFQRGIGRRREGWLMDGKGNAVWLLLG